MLNLLKPTVAITFYLLLILCQLTLTAQTTYLFENYTSEKGLSQNSCYSIAQDSDGMMWFGTQDGLNRYDGKEFRFFLPHNEAGKELPSNYISSLYYEKSKQLLWIGTIQGTCIYDTRSDSLIKVTKRYPSVDELAFADIKKIIPGKENEIWFVTYSFGLMKFNTKTNQYNRYFFDSVYRKKVSSVAYFQNKVIAAVQGKLMMLNNQSGIFEPLYNNFQFPEIRELYVYRNRLCVGTLNKGCYIIDSPLQMKSLPKNILSDYGGIGSFTSDGAGNLWVGTRGSGLLILDTLLQTLQTAYNKPFNNRSIGKNFVLSLFTDRQGITWAGLSGGGVAKYDPGNYKFQNIGNEKDNITSLPDNMVFTLHRTADGLFYAGTQNKGIYGWELPQNKFTEIKESAKFGNIINTIYDITDDEQKNLWAASWGGLIKISAETKQIHFYTNPDILTSSKLYGIHKLKNADSLFITGENGFVFFSLKDYQWKPCITDQQSSNLIGRYVYEDEKGILWICTIGQGLVSYDYKNNRCVVKQKVKEKTNYVRHLFRENNLFWLSTDNGIIVYDYLKDTILQHFLPGNSTQSNVCYALEKDKYGNYWVSSNSGLYRIKAKDFSIRSFDMANGLAFPEYNTACVLKQDDGTIIFGGVGGITKFNPTDFKDNNYSPAPLIANISINSLPWRPALSIIHSKEIELSYKENFLTIYFAVTNFSISGKQQFRYRLRGVSDNWIESQTLNFANYTQLKPANYIFELQSANSDGIWSKEITSLIIRIKPPWWKTNWFYAVTAALLASILYFLFKRRINQVRYKAEMKQKITETEMKALRVQMNPHFIFNSLNSINSFIIQNKTHLASDYITKFSRLIRLILDNSTNEKITLEKEIETLQLYLLMESLRFNNKFEYAINTEKDLDVSGIKIPPMLIQPFIENAIWHGLLHLTKPGKVIINLLLQQDHLEITIEDNGIGRKKAGELKSKESNNRKSYGIQITNDRLAAISKLNKVTITDRLNEYQEVAGTIVTIYIYLHNT